MILAILWGALAWAALVLALKAARLRDWFGVLVCVCLAALFADACAWELVAQVLITAVEAAGR